ncbi:hypothetical protein TNCV_2585891 [Trichonephila clavipes]|nr:hypothetical protein TNCV_2585891 [Trichonephila clavipes]
MCKLSKTRPLPRHNNIGSLNTRRKLHPGVPPPTTESNKGASVPVIWQNQARRLPEIYPESSATASGRGSNGRLTGVGSLLPPVYSEAWAKGIPRTPFSFLRDAAHSKHAGWLTNGVSRKKTCLWSRREKKKRRNRTTRRGLKIEKDHLGTPEGELSEGRRLPGVHPEYSSTASGRGSNGYKPDTLSAALTLQQCFFGNTEERYQQPINWSGHTPASCLQRSVGQRYSLREAAHGKHAGRKTNVVRQKQIR